MFDPKSRAWILPLLCLISLLVSLEVDGGPVPMTLLQSSVAQGAGTFLLSSLHFPLSTDKKTIKFFGRSIWFCLHKSVLSFLQYVWMEVPQHIIFHLVLVLVWIIGWFTWRSDPFLSSCKVAVAWASRVIFLSSTMKFVLENERGTTVRLWTILKYLAIKSL